MPTNISLTRELPLSQQLLWMTQGYILSQVVHVIAKLGIADHLTYGPQTSHALAQATATDADALDRLLLTGAAFGLLEEVAPHSFNLTPPGELLRSEVPGSMRDYAIAMVAPGHWLPCGHLEQTIKSGKVPLTPTGKVDRGALPPPSQTRPELERSFLAPRTSSEQLLQRFGHKFSNWIKSVSTTTSSTWEDTRCSPRRLCPAYGKPSG